MLRITRCYKRLNSADGKLKTDSNNWKPTDVAKQADVALRLASPPAAEVENAEPADREVVAHRIVFAESSEAIGDASSGLPVRGFPAIEAEKPGDAMHMRVERYDELAWVDEIPQTEIGRSAADHPAQEEIHPLAGAAIAG